MAKKYSYDWHNGRLDGLDEAVKAVRKVRAQSKKYGASLETMIALDEALSQVRGLVAGAKDDARNDV